jgi:hypothetical protein
MKIRIALSEVVASAAIRLRLRGAGFFSQHALTT